MACAGPFHCKEYDVADLNVTFRKPVPFTINGEQFAVKPLPAGVGFRLTYLMEKIVKEREKGSSAAGKMSDDMVQAYDELADAFAANAVRPDETRAILEALKENDGVKWAWLLSQLYIDLMASQ